MEEIKAPKKERRFLKAVGEVALTLFRELLLGVGKKVINKVGNKRQGLVIAFVVLASSFAFAQYPTTGNKQRLGYQTTGDGLVYRGRASDTVSLKSTGLNNAYIIIDTLQNVMYNYIKTKGGWKFNNTDTVIINNNFSQPVDSLFFNVGVPTNNVDTAKMRWDSDLATVVLGLNDNVPNELGFKNFWLVKNQTGSTITKGSIVYANGTVGASGRITVAKFIANGTIDAKYLLGITAHDLSNGEDGYVISFGKIRKVNTDTFAAGAILYPSPTTAGVWTDVEPIAPNIDMPIGFCINSHANNGTIAIRVASGYSLNELHNVAISSPVEKSSLYYSGGLWRDTTTALLVSDTASMLTNYLRSGVASNTYLPLTGGTLTGALSGTTGTFTGLNIVNPTTEGILTLQGFDNNTPTRIQFKTGNEIRKQIVLPTSDSNLEFRTSTIGGTQGGYSFYTRRNPNAEQLAFNIDFNKDIQMYGALSVTGATTLSNLAGSGTRMVTASSTGLLSTQAIPTGTVTSVGGTGTVNGITLTGTVTSSGNLSLGGTLSNVSLTSQVTGTLPILNGGTGATSASAARSNLGGTTLGQSMFTLTNPSAITFPRFNADNTISALDAASFRTAIGAGTGNGNGTVTNIDVTAPLTISNPTTTPLIQITAANGTSTSGVVTTAAQQFGGAKTFNANLTTNGNMEVDGTLNVDLKATFGAAIKATSLERNVVNTTGTSITLGIATTWLNIHQSSNFTITLPNAATYPGKEIHIRNSSSGVVLSASSNVIDMAVSHAGSTTTIIMSGGTPGQFTTLVSDGTNWIQTQLDNN